MQLNIHNFSTLQDAINFANDQIDQAAGNARAKYLTVAAGQEATYLAKYQDARAFKAANYLPVDGTGFYWVQAEAATLGVSPENAADGILTGGDLWNNVKGPQIEGLRIGGKAALGKLSSVQDVLSSAYTTKKSLTTV